MKIAIISDIHGNMEALNEVLKDMESISIDRIFICGDLAMAGSEPEKTVDIIIELVKQNKASVILGNTDEMIIKEGGFTADGCTPSDTASLKRSQQMLRADQVDFLKTLSPRHSEKIGELEILLVHGSPRKIDEGIAPNMTEQTLKEILIGVKEDIIFCGHTHLPVIYKINNKTIVNDGSVGRPFTKNPDACYAVLDYPDLNGKDFSISHRFVKYDK